MTGDPPARRVLGIDVRAELLLRWRDWLMPTRQPFVVPSAVAAALGLADDRSLLTAETADSFELYGVDADSVIVHLDRAGSRALPASVRSAQRAPHRWPTKDPARDIERAVARVERRRRPSRHGQLDADRLRRIEAVLPGIRGIAGTFPEGSGPNCFGTVMGAAGVAGAARTWMQVEPFETWLRGRARPIGRREHTRWDGEIGTVLVWSDENGAAAHAAITLGDGLLLEKASQGWMSPARVLSVREGIMSAREPGLHLHRWRPT